MVPSPGVCFGKSLGVSAGVSWEVEGGIVRERRDFGRGCRLKVRSEMGVLGSDLGKDRHRVGAGLH